jgi:hypothetical protein
MSAENSLRVGLSLFGICAVIFGPPWLVLVPMALLSMRFRAAEVILIGLFADFLWSPGLQLPLFLIASIVIVWAFEPLRKELLLS